jgi:hypothetical protein
LIWKLSLVIARLSDVKLERGYMQARQNMFDLLKKGKTEVASPAWRASVGVSMIVPCFLRFDDCAVFFNWHENSPSNFSALGLPGQIPVFFRYHPARHGSRSRVFCRAPQRLGRGVHAISSFV